MSEKSSADDIPKIKEENLVPLTKLQALKQKAKNCVVDMISGPTIEESQEAIDELANGSKHESRKTNQTFPKIDVNKSNP